jgi:hypothetical protein
MPNVQITFIVQKFGNSEMIKLFASYGELLILHQIFLKNLPLRRFKLKLIQMIKCQAKQITSIIQKFGNGEIRKWWNCLFDPVNYTQFTPNLRIKVTIA